MNRRLLLPLFAALLAVLPAAAPAQAAVGPLYDIRTTWGDSNLPPGGEGQFTLQVRNVGEEAKEEALTITAQLPAGVTATAVHWDHFLSADLSSYCSGLGTGTVTCVLPAAEVPVRADDYLGPIYIDVAIALEPLPANPGQSRAIVYGGAAELPDGSPCAGSEIELATLPPCAEDEDWVPFSPTPSAFDIRPGSFAADVFSAAYPFGVPSRQAADHPFEQRFNFELTQYSAVSTSDGTRYTDSTALTRTVEATLPRGMVGNPEALPKCDPLLFATKPFSRPACPSDTQVGYINISIGVANANYGRGGFGTAPNLRTARVPIYNLEPPKGTPVDLAFAVEGLVQAHIFAALDPAQNYAVKSVTPNIAAPLNISTRAVEVTIWGVPGDPAHDRLRYYPEKTEGKEVGAPWGSAPIRPFYTNPADCSFDNGGHRIRAESYQQPGVLTPVQEYDEPLNVSGCENPRFHKSFEPDIALQPTDRHAAAPTGLDVHLVVPQRNDEVDNAEKLYAENGYVKGISTPPMKKAVVTFPEGMTLNPSAAQGLVGCAPDQIKLGTNDPVTCPDSSQYGTLTLHTPILPVDEQPEGFIYIAKQQDNPFHNFLSLYMVIQEPDRGILIKIPGRIDLNPVTGRITTTFDDLPQFPVSDMQMTLKGGVRAGLVNPATCGAKTIRAEFFSWHDPTKPQEVSDSYEITQRPDGSACVNSLAERPFRPSIEAGTLNPTAGAYSPFLMRLTRTDDDQEFSQLGATLPPGLAARFAGVSICPEAGFAQAEQRTAAGQGALEQADPSCPAAAQIGTTQVGTGVGVPLTYVPGKVYLSGPYKGAPISLVVISPAIVGPYDLGVIAVRTALNVNRETAQGSATSDPFPLIFQGIPVRIRDIRLKLDRDGFTLNPTSCATKQIEARITGTGGNLGSTADDSASELTGRFQASDCASLRFKPRLSLRLFGGTHRGAHPKLRAVLRMPEGGANIAGAAVTLPSSEFLDQDHIRTVCTRVKFAAKQCPRGSVYGHAEAITPLFAEPLKGPVYLRSSSHKLPDLVAALRGPDSQPVEVDLVGRIDSVRLKGAEGSGIRNSFELVPDAPVSRFTLTMQGGDKGLLQNSTDLCRHTYRARARFTAHNGRVATLRPTLRSSCRKRRRLK